MTAVLGVAALWLVFGGLHVGLATRRVRAALVSRFGETGFLALFSLLAAVSFSGLVHFYSLHRYDGPAGLALGAVPAFRWALMTVVVVGVVLMVASLVGYPSSPMAVLNDTVRAPRGIERVTRHPFFFGVALLGAAHALLATRLVGVLLMAGVVLLAVAGAWHQDRKLLRLRGEPYAAYLNATSMVPFAAIVAGRQRLAVGELPFGALALGAILAVVLRTVHGSIFARGGAWVIVVVLGGAALATVQSARRVVRRRRRRRDSATTNPLARWFGPLFLAIAVGHALVGLVIFHDPLAAIVRDGFVNGVEPHLLERGLAPYFDREAAFWFMLYAPILALLGLVTRRAIDLGDVPLLRLVGWTLLATGGAGALAMPVSGFWLIIVLGALVLRSARLDVRTNALLAAGQIPTT